MSQVLLATGIEEVGNIYTGSLLSQQVQCPITGHGHPLPPRSLPGLEGDLEALIPGIGNSTWAYLGIEPSGVRTGPGLAI